MNILITGASGLLGKKLLVDLQKLGHSVRGVARNKESLIEIPKAQTYSWDALKDQKFPIKALDQVEVVIHLAGVPVADQRWNKKIKSDILKSRVDGTRQLVQAIESLKPEDRPQTFISGSAIGFYGNCDQATVTESSSKGSDFLADVVDQWEKESHKAQDLGLRTVILRTSVVLSRHGGALAKMPPVIIGNGKNQMSWIHIQDWINFTIEAAQNKKFQGIYNLSSPKPVSQSLFIKALAQARSVPLVLWAPKVIVQTALGEMADVLLTSQKVIPQAALDQGFQFQFEDIDQAMNDIYKSEDYLVQDLSVAQFIPSDIESVFHFFSEAKNLEKITPDFLNFRIDKMSTPEIKKNTIIDYKLKIHGVPAKWQTQIIEWLPNQKFIDFQNKGPYSLWHHTHSFTQIKDGTLIEDRIKYKIPGHLIGLLFLGSFIKKDVNSIFKHRIDTIKSVFKIT